MKEKKEFNLKIALAMNLINFDRRTSPRPLVTNSGGNMDLCASLCAESGSGDGQGQPGKN